MEIFGIYNVIRSPEKESNTLVNLKNSGSNYQPPKRR
jgi:hypothetical protein